MDILPRDATDPSDALSEKASLLARRMVALGLAPDAVKRTEADMFFVLRRLCARCEYNDLCESDLSGQHADLAWVDYCPNALLLNALCELSWFRAPD